MIKNLKRLGLAGLVLGNLSILSPNFTYAEDTKEVSVENNSPKLIATFEYKSNREGYEGVPFMYNLWSDGKISQADKEGVKFAQRWFYDVDNDGEFGDAEINAIEFGKLVYMHPEFNKIANGQLKKILNEMKLRGEEKITQPEVIPEESGKGQFRGYPDFQEFDEAQSKKFLGCPYFKNFDKVVQKTDALTTQKPTKERLQKDNGLHLILGANTSTNSNSFGGTIGLQYTPFKEFGFSILGNFNKTKDKNLDFVQTPNFRGIYGTVDINETNSISVGPSLEVQTGPLFIGGGFNYWSWINKVEEKIMRNDTILKSNINSVSHSQRFGNIYLGLEFKFKNFGLGAKAGYDFKEGPYAGMRTTIRLNKPKREYKK